MTTWEYLTRPTTVSLAELNRLGGDGWEAVSQLERSEQTAGGGWTEERSILLRRPVRPAEMVTGD
jgi:hypothetical protein